MPLQENENKNNNFKLDTAAFCGYAKAKLETIGQDIEEIKKSLGSVKWKVAALGGTISIIVTIVTLLVRKHIGL